MGPIGSAVLTLIGHKQPSKEYIDLKINKFSREAILIDPVIEKSERDAKLVEELDLKLK